MNNTFLKILIHNFMLYPVYTEQNYPAPNLDQDRGILYHVDTSSGS